MRFFTGRSLALSALSLGGALALASGAGADPLQLPPRILDPGARIINVSAATQVFHKTEPLRFNVLRAVAGTCAEVRVSIDGKQRAFKNVTFPWALEIPPGDALYPTKSEKYDVAVDGVLGCSGRATFTFAYNGSDKGVITDVQVSGFSTGTTPDQAQVLISGHGLCSIRVATYNAPYDRIKSTPNELQFLYAPVRLPVTVPLKRSGSIAAQWGQDQVIEVYAMAVKADGTPDDTGKTYSGFTGCTISIPGRQSDFMFQKTFPTTKAPKGGTSSGGNAGNGGGNTGGGNTGGAPAGGGNVPSGNKPATGNITAMSVPGGSFAEDEAQKLQVNGTGGCALDLTLSNKMYNGSTEQTWPVNPVKLDSGALLYNGTHFGTLAEGSWRATATGKSGCTGTAQIDFKVTPKTSTKKVMGKPTITFDQKPKSGDTFMASKDSSIWFKVTVPQSIKDEPYASCCDIEYDYVNEYGGWEPLPSSPFSDASYALAVSQQAGVAMRSVSYFSNATRWRVKMRAYKYKTEFEWSDWLEFKVDQH